MRNDFGDYIVTGEDVDNLGQDSETSNEDGSIDIINFLEDIDSSLLQQATATEELGEKIEALIQAHAHFMDTISTTLSEMNNSIRVFVNLYSRSLISEKQETSKNPE